MSMIGLLSGAPQPATAKASSGDAAAAEGFGSSLQGALDALVEAAANHQGEPEQPTAEDSPIQPAAAIPAQVAQLSLVTPAGDPSPAASPAALGPTVEPASMVSPSPAAASPAATQPAPRAETPTSNSSAASTSAASSTSAAAPVAQAQLTQAPEANPLPVSTTAANVAAPAANPSTATAATPLVQSRPTLEGANDSSESGVRPVGAENSAGNSPSASTSSPIGPSSPIGSGSASVVAPLVPNPVNSPPLASSSSATAAAIAATTLREAPVSTPPTVTQTNASAEAAPAQVPTAVATPVSALVSAPQPVAPASSVAAPAATASVPFATQLARPIFSLAAGGAGEHVMTVSVTPDNLGPVTVRAHVGAEGVRVELFAPNDLGRDAIRAIIPELRRDLAGAGLGGNLSLSSQNQPSADGSAHGSGAGQPGERDGRLAAGSVPASADGLALTEHQVDRSGLFGTTSTIDVLA